MNKNKNILFFSNSDKNSITCVQRIKTTHLVNNIILFCLEENKNKIPSFVQNVPMLLIGGGQILHGRPLFDWINQQTSSQQQQQFSTGSQYPNTNIPPSAFTQQQQSQLDLTPEQRLQQMQREVGGQQPQQGNQMSSNGNNFGSSQQNGGNGYIDGPMAFHMGEMDSSLSDGYSFLNADTDTQKGSGGQMIGHSFAFLDEKKSIYTPTNNNISGGSIGVETQAQNNNKDEMTLKMEQMMANRDNEIPQGITRT